MLTALAVADARLRLWLPHETGDIGPFVPNTELAPSLLTRPGVTPTPGGLGIWRDVLPVSTSSIARAVVTRHGVDDARYRLSASGFLALVDMPGEGRAVLLASQWVVTAGHTTPADAEFSQVTINGVAQSVEQIGMHPGYRSLPHVLIGQAMAS